MRPLPDPPVEQQASADAGTEGQRHGVPCPACGSYPGLASHRRPPVMLDTAGRAEERREGIGELEPGEVREVCGAETHRTVRLHRAADGEADAIRTAAGHLARCRRHRGKQVVPRDRTPCRNDRARQHHAVRREADRLEVGPADIEADQAHAILSGGRLEHGWRRIGPSVGVASIPTVIHDLEGDCAGAGGPVMLFEHPDHLCPSCKKRILEIHLHS